MARAALTRPGLPQTIAAPLQLKPLSCSKGSCAILHGHLGSPLRLPSLLPHGDRHLHSTLPRKPFVATAAAVTAGAFPQPFHFSLKRHLRQLLSSPHDKEIWAVALPALVAMLLEPVLNALNAGLVGHLGTQQLSAVSLGSLAVSLCTFFYTFLLFLTVPEIAAAAVRNDKDEVSYIAAKSMWIAVVCGVVSAAGMWSMAGSIVAVLNPPEDAVAMYAIDYIKVRSLGIPAVLLSFVATAVFRGAKDTRTPMIGAIMSAGASLGLNVWFLYVLKAGVVGSAAATASAQFVSCVLLLGALAAGGWVQGRHLVTPPSLGAMLPTIKLGAVLGARNIISFGMVIYASALSIREGSTNQASFEIIRQVWILAIQFFECLNVATQALCASYLGNQDPRTARSLLDRLLFLGMSVGALAAVAVWAVHEPLIAFFTRDAQVVAQALETLPLIVFFFPIDAAASIMDGSLLAAKQSNYMSAVQIAGCVLQYGALSYMAAMGDISTLTVWGALKILIVIRVITGGYRNYVSSKSAYVVQQTPEAGAVAVAAADTGVAATAPATQLSARTAPGADVSHVPQQPSESEAAPDHVTATTTARTTVGTTAPVIRVRQPSVTTSPPTVATTAVQHTSPALQSFEDDALVLAFAAATAAIDLPPELLGLKQRPMGHSESDGDGGSNDVSGGDAGGGDGDGVQASAEEEAPSVPRVANAVHSQQTQ